MGKNDRTLAGFKKANRCSPFVVLEWLKQDKKCGYFQKVLLLIPTKSVREGSYANIKHVYRWAICRY